MAINKDVNTTLGVKDDLSPTLEKVNQSLDKKLKNSFDRLGTSMVKVNQSVELVGRAFSKVDKAFSAVVNAAAKQEAAINKVNSSLLQMGEYTPEVSAELQAYAAAMQDVTKIGDETTLGQLAFAQAMGANVEQSKMVVAAAADMSAALGMDFNSAVRNLSKTLGGLPGELGEVLPELKALSKEQLQAGKGIDLLAKKYKGFAARELQTFEGATAQAGNAWGDLLEQVGFVITQNPQVIKAITSSTQMFKDLAKTISELDFTAMLEGAKEFGIALGIASSVVGGYILVANAAAVATSLWASASAVLAGTLAIITSPITLVVLAVAGLTAGIYLLMKNLDLVIGALKVGFAYALEVATFGLRTFIQGLSMAVGFFNKEWAQSLDNTVKRMDNIIESMKKSGKAQIAAAKNAEAQAEATKKLGSASDEANKKIISQEQALVKLNAQYAKAIGAADSAFAAAQEFSPGLKLDKFLEEQAILEKSLEELKTKGEALKISLSADTSGSEEVKAQIDAITAKQIDAEEALKSLKIRKQQEIREARLAELSIELELQKQKIFTVDNEISQMRLEHAQQTRDQLIEIETQRLLSQRGLLYENLQNSISIEQAARLQANQVELDMLTAKLEAEADLAVDHETAKQDAIERAKKNGLQKQLKLAQRHGSFMDRLRLQSQINEIEGAGRVAKAKAFFQSQEVQTAGDALSNLATLTSSHSKKMFEIGKAASIASAIMNTAQGFTKALADNGPILGPILGATVLAAGAVQIANIKEQKFSGGGGSVKGSSGAAPSAPTPSATLGGQADKGMDAVPKSLSGKSFVLSAGERVVQPEANKDLTNFLQNPNSGNTYNFTIMGNVDSEDRVNQLADTIADRIREKSERGEIVISSKGVA